MIDALRWLDYAWTEEGIMWWNFGEENVSYTLNKDGKAVITELVNGDPLGASNGKFKYLASHGAFPGLSRATGIDYDNATENDFASNEAGSIWYENTESPKHKMPSLQMSVEDKERVTELMSAIQTYVTEEGRKFLVCERPFSEYDSFVDGIYKMGIEEVLEIYQKYYDEYVAK